jgi:hypothetical protein
MHKVLKGFESLESNYLESFHNITQEAHLKLVTLTK